MVIDEHFVVFIFTRLVITVSSILISPEVWNWLGGRQLLWWENTVAKAEMHKNVDLGRLRKRAALIS